MDIEEYIEKMDFTQIGKKTTVCLITLSNGFEVCASSACIDEAQYDFEVGMLISRELCLQKVYEYLVIVACAPTKLKEKKK